MGIFEELRRERRLLTTVHQLNLLLDQTAHREVARSALKRMGLEYDGISVLLRRALPARQDPRGHLPSRVGDHSCGGGDG
jgi:hypothetical protein